MITLYHCADARSFRCLWLLEELALPYHLTMLGFPPRLKAPEFLQVNPTGTVPWLQDGAVGLSESAAILEYLAVRHSPRELAVAADEPVFGDWLNWLHFGEASLATPLATALRYALLEAPEKRLPVVADAYQAQFVARLAPVEAALAGHAYLAADRFTTADISVGYALMLSRPLGLHKGFPEAIQAYWSRLSERPAFQRAKARQKAAMASTAPTATKEVAA